jgi:hypothetical protein
VPEATQHDDACLWNSVFHAVRVRRGRDGVVVVAVAVHRQHADAAPIRAAALRSGEIVNAACALRFG